MPALSKKEEWEATSGRASVISHVFGTDSNRTHFSNLVPSTRAGRAPASDPARGASGRRPATRSVGGARADRVGLPVHRGAGLEPLRRGVALQRRPERHALALVRVP